MRQVSHTDSPLQRILFLFPPLAVHGWILLQQHNLISRCVCRWLLQPVGKHSLSCMSWVVQYCCICSGRLTVVSHLTLTLSFCSSRSLVQRDTNVATRTLLPWSVRLARIAPLFPWHVRRVMLDMFARQGRPHPTPRSTCVQWVAIATAVRSQPAPSTRTTPLWVVRMRVPACRARLAMPVQRGQVKSARRCSAPRATTASSHILA